MVANTNKNKKTIRKHAAGKEPNKIVRAASMKLPKIARYFADHDVENADGFTKSGRVTDDEIRRTPQPWRLYLQCVVRPTQLMINGVWCVEPRHKSCGPSGRRVAGAGGRLGAGPAGESSLRRASWPAPAPVHARRRLGRGVAVRVTSERSG